MAIESTDLFVAYRPGNATHYSVPWSVVSSETGLPDGAGDSIMLKWDGFSWVITNSIDGGTYA